MGKFDLPSHVEPPNPGSHSHMKDPGVSLHEAWLGQLFWLPVLHSSRSFLINNTLLFVIIRTKWTGESQTNGVRVNIRMAPFSAHFGTQIVKKLWLRPRWIFCQLRISRFQKYIQNSMDIGNAWVLYSSILSGQYGIPKINFKMKFFNEMFWDSCYIVTIHFQLFWY